MIVLATLCLNEMEHLPNLYAQHRAWPGLQRWVFVEAADRVFAATNPARVSPAGLSVDGTTEYLQHLATIDPRVTYVPHGFCSAPDPAQGKVQARQRYLEVAAREPTAPRFLVVLDADEYYTYAHQKALIRTLACAAPSCHMFLFRQRHIWRPPSLADAPLFALEVVGGYWAVPHCRVWRWEPGLRYLQNHNWPEDARGTLLINKGPRQRFDRQPGTPECIHLGFASTLESRAAKHAYYAARGEGTLDKRQSYVDCRAAFERWAPGQSLPHGALVVKYTGPIPEVFRDP